MTITMSLPNETNYSRFEEYKKRRILFKPSKLTLPSMISKSNMVEKWPL